MSIQAPGVLIFRRFSRIWRGLVNSCVVLLGLPRGIVLGDSLRGGHSLEIGAVAMEPWYPMVAWSFSQDAARRQS